MADHDQTFKRLIETFFQEFMELFCPQEAALIDFTNVEFLKQEYFTDVVEGEQKLLDLVAKVALKGGGDEVILVHDEFESSRKAEDFPKRMFLYYSQLYARHKKVIVPIALFSDDAKWRKPVPDHFEIALPTKTFVRFDYYLIKLKHWTTESSSSQTTHSPLP